MENYLKDFENVANEIFKLCLFDKERFNFSNWHYIIENTSFPVRIWFSNSYSEYTLKCNDIEYEKIAYGKSTFKLPVSSIHDSQYLEEILKTMEDALSIMKKKYIGKKRELNFKKLNNETI
mgnify:CR=1 FL=1